MRRGRSEPVSALEDLRRRAGFDLATFAAACGVSRAYLSRVELGQEPSPSPRFRSRACALLGAHLNHILFPLTPTTEGER